MSTSRTIPLMKEIPLEDILHVTEQQLWQKGFQTQVYMMNAATATLTVTKDRDGFKNILGMGLECRANITVMNNIMQVNIEDEWTNKILAMAIGWILCWIPFITGIIGCVGQSELGGKVANDLQFAANSLANGG